MRKVLTLLLAGAVFTSVSCDSESSRSPEEEIDSLSNIEVQDDFSAKGASKDPAVIYDFNFQPVGHSTLHRNDNGITMNFKATGLIPNHAYTVWWVVWNNPEACEGGPGACGTEADFVQKFNEVKVEIMYATGHVAGNSGKGNFSAHLNENDDSGSINDLQFLPPFGGLLDSREAEVHLVLRSHGPAVPGIVNEQIGSYLGGCPTEFPYGFVFTEIPDEVGECGDIYFSIHPPE